MADMTPIRERLSAHRANLFCHTLTIVLLTTGNDGVGPPFGKRENHRPTQTSTSTRYKDDLVRKIK